MPSVIAIQGDPDEHAIQTAVQSLKAGKTIGLPTATGYASAQIGDSGVTHAFGLPVRHAFVSPESALQSLPEPSGPLARLLGRCWPGPLIVSSPDREVTVPSHPFLQDLLAAFEPASLTLSSDQGDARFTTAGALGAAEPGGLEVIFDAGKLMYDQSASVVRPTVEGFEIVFSGILSEQAIRLSACEIYTFVCTGNTCRSPLAEGMFRKLLADSLQCSPDEVVERGYLVESAGLAAAMGAPASPESVALLQSRGVDLSKHTSQPLTAQLVDASDHIFTMTNRHRDAILGYRPDLAETVQVLRRDGSDVVDPIGGGMGEYQRCEQEIEESLRAIMNSHFKKGSD